MSGITGNLADAAGFSPAVHKVRVNNAKGGFKVWKIRKADGFLGYLGELAVQIFEQSGTLFFEFF
ncbi:hypothetical protein D3C87_2036250 [compost metagenome]